MKVQVLAFGAHPDDVELGCGGTLILHQLKGYTTGIIDLTYGELGTRGTVDIRKKEAENASKVMNLSIRENLGFRDGFFKNDEEHKLKIIEVIRAYQPDIVICNALTDRHPDHGRGGDVVEEAAFLSGLRMIETKRNNENQQPWRPSVVYRYIQFRDLKPDFLVDISDVMETKLNAIKMHSSQFYDPNSIEPSTLISSPEFLDNVKNRASYYGQYIGAKYAEGFTSKKLIGVSNLFDLK